MSFLCHICAPDIQQVHLCGQTTHCIGWRSLKFRGRRDLRVKPPTEACNHKLWPHLLSDAATWRIQTRSNSAFCQITLVRHTCFNAFLDGSGSVAAQYQRLVGPGVEHFDRRWLRSDSESHVRAEVVEADKANLRWAGRRCWVMDLQLIRTNTKTGKAVNDRLQEGAHARQKVYIPDVLITRITFRVLRPYL